MARTLWSTHLQEGDYRKALLFSVLGHVVLFASCFLGIHLFPPGEPLRIGTGPGGGQGNDFVAVGLAADAGGGAGMYKPALTPAPPAAPPPREPERAAEPPPPQAPVFEEKKTPPKKRETPAADRHPAKTETKKAEAPPGQIPREPDPGRGEAGGSRGSGGGFGGGSGVLVGSGTGEEGNIDSWYVRQVEQRIGQNWLRSSLGDLARRVEAVASFEIRPSGQIENIRIERKSGIESVDLAVLRAIQASNPLPPLPYEFRSRRVQFQAVFQYPP